MSGDRCLSGGGKGSTKYPQQGRIVRPEVVNEKSFVENVAGFINEVVLPASSHNPTHFDNKETIEWVKFERFDLNDACLADDSKVLPLLLIIGYTKGVQGWFVPDIGEAQEVFSFRRNVVRCVKLLPSPLLPESFGSTVHDIFSSKRPLLAMCDESTVSASGSSPLYNVLTFESLRTGETVKTYKFQHPIIAIEANRRVVVVCFPERLAVLCATSLDERFTVTSCYPAPSLNVNPIALGESWLAYADRKLHPHYKSGGGACAESSRSYKTTMIQYAKSFSKNILDLKETLLGGSAPKSPSSSVGQYGAPPTTGVTHSPSPPTTTNLSGYNPGVVTILDVETVPCGDVNLNQSGVRGIVAHFVANMGYAVVALEFDPSGCLLLTADEPGHYFNVFRIHPHPMISGMSAVHHIYSLHRGDTTAKVVDISFSFDSRWVSVSTMRGTTHVFPITPYGGEITERTHTSPCVVNKQSRYERSVRLDESQSPSGRNSPSATSSSGSSSSHHHCTTENCCAALAYHNPRIAPFPSPCDISPFVQLRQPLLANLLGTIGASPTPGRSGSSGPPLRGSSPYSDCDLAKVASTFGPPRGWVAGSPMQSPLPSHSGPCTDGFSLAASDALYVMAYHGNLIQYSLQPRPSPYKSSGGRSHSNSSILLEAHAIAQWSLLRDTDSSEVRTPLLESNPLLHIPSISPPSAQSSLPPHHASHTAFSPNTSPPEEVDTISWPGELDIITHGGPDRRNCLGPQFVLRPEVYPFSLEQTPVVDPYSVSGSARFTRSSPVDIQGGASPIIVDTSSYGSGSYSASPSLVERMSCLHMGSSSDITSQIQQDISDALEDDTSIASKSAGDHHQDDLERYMGGSRAGEEYEGPFGTVVGRRTPSMASHWSGSSRSLEDVDGDLHMHPYGRTRQMSATQYPTHQPIAAHLHVQSQHYGPSPPTKVITTKANVQSGDLEEFKGLTSSAEELSTTLVAGYQKGGSESRKKQSTWVPIDVASYESGNSPVPLKCPEPTKSSSEKLDNASVWSSCGSSKGGMSLNLNPKKVTNEVVGGVGTSDDDAWTISEMKKERKKKKKRSKNGDSADVTEKTSTEDVLLLTSDHFKVSPETKETEPATLNVTLCIDENQDHSTPVLGTFDEHGNIATSTLVDNLDDFQLQADDDQNEKNGNPYVRKPRTRCRLISEHGDDELAKALEEARSDDDTQAVTPPTVRRIVKVSENFPYRVSSSDEEEEQRASSPPKIIRQNSERERVEDFFEMEEESKKEDWPSLDGTAFFRGGVSTGEEASTDDRGETSGEDRRYGGGVSVGGSLSEPTVQSSKSKKKRKKRR